jgi:DNA modification methylase
MRGDTQTPTDPGIRWERPTPEEEQLLGSNKRSVWHVPTQSFKGAHCAVFPPDLIRPCIRAGARPGDTVLDPFAGSGTTGQVAPEEGRKAILIEVNPDYLPLIEQRLNSVQSNLKVAA